MQIHHVLALIGARRTQKGRRHAFLFIAIIHPVIRQRIILRQRLQRFRFGIQRRGR